ncbi:superfamily II DNA or RNA helicase [Desulfosalsimonas propionicica]|uniref:Superfamily II DNA or RNA helicase n=1 Tax=Desulfosalsimonas propionicica TaxID=332175 RepID=A0A7W0CCL6_9BACT|nr:helicase-related protein [Desulfosalsimonas propionicica]MBA2883182.1 superfamily II DNA or RNA helicase [Desulfosalsimonas propionicica]
MGPFVWTTAKQGLSFWPLPLFRDTQAHALAVRDLINQFKESRDPCYCVRMTGKEGDRFLAMFRDNEKTIPTILTTSQKLSTGVDARNVRNIVLMRPVNSMIEFKQNIGRGTRLFEGKDYFTIYDFVKAYEHFSDPEWDGEPLPREPCPVCGRHPCICRKNKKVKVKAVQGRRRAARPVEPSGYPQGFARRPGGKRLRH